MKRLLSVLVCLSMLLSCALGESADYSGEFSRNLSTFFDGILSGDMEGFALKMEPTGEEPLEAVYQQEDGTASLRAEIPGRGTAEVQASEEAVYASVDGKTYSLGAGGIPGILAGLGLAPLSFSDLFSYMGLASEFASEVIQPLVSVENTGKGSRIIRAEIPVKETLAKVAAYGDRIVNEPEYSAPLLTVVNAVGLAKGFSLDEAGLKEAWAGIREKLLSVETDAVLSLTVTNTYQPEIAGNVITVDARYTVGGNSLVLTGEIEDGRMNTNVEMRLARSISGEETELIVLSSDYSKREQTASGRLAFPAAEFRWSGVFLRKGFHAKLDFRPDDDPGWTLNLTEAEDSDGLVFSADMAAHARYLTSWNLLATWGEYRKFLSIHSEGSAFEAEFVHDDDGGFTGRLVLPNGTRGELRGERTDSGLHAAADIYGYGRQLYGGYGERKIVGAEITYRHSYECSTANLVLDTGYITSSAQLYWSQALRSIFLDVSGNQVLLEIQPQRFRSPRQRISIPIRAELSAKGPAIGVRSAVYENGRLTLTDGDETYTITGEYEDARTCAIHVSRGSEPSAQPQVTARLSIAEDEKEGRFLDLNVVSEEQKPLLNGTLKYVPEADIQPLGEGETTAVTLDMIRQLIGW